MSGLNPTTASRVGLVLAQVVEVHALTSDGLSYGSGYQLSQNLILTARHVVDGADHVRVRFGARQDPTLLVDATVVWRGVAMDMALLELRWPDGLEASAAPVVPPTLGALPDAIVRRIPFVTVGFPAHKQRPRPGGGSLRDTDQVDGDIPTAANLKTGRLDLQREGRLLTLGRQWMGISGAAVFARGLLVGVVIQAEAEGPLVAERLSVPVGTGASAFPERQEPPESVAVFRRLVEADGLPARLVPVRREPAYAKTIADIAARRPRIEGRAAELSELAQFARSATAYQWWQAGPWAGKTTLAAHFVTHPPGEVDVVAFFISRTRGQQSDAYLRETCDQLAALLDEDPPETAGLSAFNDLWVRSIEQARLPGRHLVLVVDGLDENDTVPPVAALLPVVLDPAVHVLLFSRRHPGIPEEVDADHPLWDPARWPRRELAPSPHAEHLERRAHQDLERHLADRTARQFLGLVAAAGPFPPRGEHRPAPPPRLRRRPAGHRGGPRPCRAGARTTGRRGGTLRLRARHPAGGHRQAGRDHRHRPASVGRLPLG